MLREIAPDDYDAKLGWLQESFWWMSQPKRLGKITLWPRLEIENSSESPGRSRSTIASKYVIGAAAIT